MKSLFPFLQRKSTFESALPEALDLDAQHNGGPLIRLRDIVKRFDTAAGVFTVLKGISVDIYGGEFVGVIGKSGSGKSTLVNMVTGIDRPTSGQVFVGNTAVHSLTENQMSAWRGRNLGIVFQFFQLLPTLSLMENVMLPMDFCNMYRPYERRERAMELLRMVDMQDHADKLPSAISGGQQQRVAIARALANDPPILIADEPTGNLDSRTADAVFEMFEALVKQGKTIVMVTHDSALARRVSQTVLVADGEIVNEWVARAWPTLTHQQMLDVTHELEPMAYRAGQEIIRENEIEEHIFVIEEGEVEIALRRPGGSDVVVTRMGPGQFFGEIGMLRNERAIATVRAGHLPVQVFALDRDKFLNLLSQSESTRSALETLVRQRVRENRSARQEAK
jgi:ABC-type lipoprotein export system ATPase subunit